MQYFPAILLYNQIAVLLLNLQLFSGFLKNYVRDTLFRGFCDGSYSAEEGLGFLCIGESALALGDKSVNRVNETEERGCLVNQALLRARHNSERSGGGVRLGCSKFQSALV